jgi:hypothetical protein
MGKALKKLGTEGAYPNVIRLSSRTQTMTNAGEDVGRGGGTLINCWWERTGIHPLWKTVWKS